MKSLVARAFMLGVGTAFLILGVGFGGGLMIAKSVMEPTPPKATRIVEHPPAPPARVILPPTSEAAASHQQSATPEPQITLRDVQPPEVTAPNKATAVPNAAPPSFDATTVEPKSEERAAERAERRKADAEERERRKRLAERKAKREAARLAKQQHPQQMRQPGILAFDDDEQRPPRSFGFFGND